MSSHDHSQKPDAISKEQSPYVDALDQSIESLDPTIRRRLNQARMAAVKQKPQIWQAWFKPAGFLASATAIAITVMLVAPNYQSDIQADWQQPLLTDVMSEDPDMLDDLEMLFWLAEEVQSGS